MCVYVCVHCIYQGIQINRERVSQLVIHKLPKGGPDVFNKFMDCLRETEGQEFIAEHLEEALPSNKRTELTDDKIVEMLNDGN